MKTKWEYQILSIPKSGDVVPELNKLGDDGWELVQVIVPNCYLKRPKD